MFQYFSVRGTTVAGQSFPNKPSNCFQCRAVFSLCLLSLSQKGEKEIKKREREGEMGEEPIPSPTISLNGLSSLSGNVMSTKRAHEQPPAAPDNWDSRS